MRQVYDFFHKKDSDAFIAVQSGEMVSFIFRRQVDEIQRLTGEPASVEGDSCAIHIHRLRFPSFVERLRLVTERRIVWAERFSDGGFRLVADFPPHTVTSSASSQTS